jgi:hypothetical protein
MLKIGGENRGSSMDVWYYIVDIQHSTLSHQLSMELDAVKYMCTKGIDRGISIYIYYIVCIVVVCTDILGLKRLILADQMAIYN